jgi:hypothetical protein
MTHKLNGPHEWLLERAQHWNADALYKALSGLAYQAGRPIDSGPVPLPNGQ